MQWAHLLYLSHGDPMEAAAQVCNRVYCTVTLTEGEFVSPWHVALIVWLPAVAYTILDQSPVLGSDCAVPMSAPSRFTVTACLELHVPLTLKFEETVAPFAGEVMLSMEVLQKGCQLQRLASALNPLRTVRSRIDC